MLLLLLLFICNFATTNDLSKINVSPHRSLLLMGLLTLVGTGVGVYIMAMAVMSPCPLLVNEASGGVIMVSTVTVFFFFFF